MSNKLKKIFLLYFWKSNQVLKEAWEYVIKVQLWWWFPNSVAPRGALENSYPIKQM